MYSLNGKQVQVTRQIMAALGLLTSVFILVACGGLAVADSPTGPSTPGRSPIRLEGTQWTLTSLHGREPVQETNIALGFLDGKINGYAGCNQYGGDYVISKDGLRISNLAQTEMACLGLDGAMEQESAYLEALRNARSFRVIDNRLEMGPSASETTLVFARSEPLPTEPNQLEGTSWHLTSIIDGEIASSVVAGSEVNLVFEDGQVSGSAGCNSYRAGVMRNDAQITFEQPTSTKKACGQPAGVMEQEQRYLRILQDVIQYQTDGQQLRLQTENGRALVYSTGT